MENSKEENLKNAFAVVRQVFTELGPLINDFEAEIDGLKPLHTGNEIGTELSKSLNHSDRWLFKYIARYYAENLKEKKRKWYAGCSVIHFGRNNKAIVPRFLIGVIKKVKPIKKEYHYWWLSSMYRSDVAAIDSDEFNGQIDDHNWYKIKSNTTGEKESEMWYDEGYLYSVKLTDIKDKQDVTKLAKELSNKFAELKK